MRRVLAGVLVATALVGATGCGGGSGSTSALHQLPITVNTAELVTCTKQLGMTDVGVTKAGEGLHKTRMVGGYGPSGAPIGIAFVADRQFARRVAHSMAATYETSIGPTGTTVVFIDPSATDGDRRIVERCVAPNR